MPTRYRTPLTVLGVGGTLWRCEVATTHSYLSLSLTLFLTLSLFLSLSLSLSLALRGGDHTCTYLL